MPFGWPVHRWDLVDILLFAPERPGVYAIGRGEEWFYVGAGNIRERLLAHYNGDNPRIIEQRPTEWAYHLCDDPEERRQRLIQELHPVCNDAVRPQAEATHEA